MCLCVHVYVIHNITHARQVPHPHNLWTCARCRGASVHIHMYMYASYAEMHPYTYMRICIYCTDIHIYTVEDVYITHTYTYSRTCIYYTLHIHIYPCMYILYRHTHIHIQLIMYILHIHIHTCMYISYMYIF